MIFTSSNLTIAFTGYNCLSYLQIAIYSFLELYPELKDCIVVFDDNSTDGTSEWLKKENIKRISWTLYPKVQDIYLYKIIYNTISLALRNSYMIDDLIRQIDTKYLLINDADLLFLRPGFMEKYSNIISSGKKLISPINNYRYSGWKLRKNRTQEALKIYLDKYYKLYNYNTGYMFRFHFCHSLLDIEYLKSKNLIFDNIYDKTFLRLACNPSILDTGAEFTYQLLENNIPYESITNVHNKNIDIPDYVFNLYDVYHFQLRSSAIRTIAIRNKEKVQSNFERYSFCYDETSCDLLVKKLKYFTNKYNISVY